MIFYGDCGCGFLVYGLAFRVEVWAQLGSFSFTGVRGVELVFGTLSAVEG